MIIMESSVFSYIASRILLWHRLPLIQSSVNLALYKDTSQSSVLRSFTSSNAVDGANENCFTNGFAHTKDGTNEWWQVDLGQVVEIKKIQIYYRLSFLRRLDGYAVNITKSLNPLETWQCYRDIDSGLPPSLTPSHECRRLGRYVKFSRERATPDSYGEKAVINLCELKVYGCPQSRYGNGDCNSSCSVGCLNFRCDPDNGNCNCSSGLVSGDKCDNINCNNGSYLQGDRCVSCSTGCVDNNCNVGTGECTKGCKPSFYGTFCNLTCTQTCYNTSCARDTGQCIGCKVGFYGDKCDKICPRNCKDKVCKQDNGYCTICTHPYKGNTCTECVDGYFGNKCTNCSEGCLERTCDQKNGQCTCKESFFGNTCNQSCPENCKNNRCNQTTGDCVDGCKNLFVIGEKCNECVDGYYGDKCTNCSEGCFERTCDKINGQCTCKESFFGNTCNQSCPENCKNNRCYQTTGYCVNGCKKLFVIGKKCKECAVGAYGENCDKECPSNCYLTKCNRMDGSCAAGCTHKNMIGNKCDECSDGFYGISCNLTCSKTCNKCIRQTGLCAPPSCTAGCNYNNMIGNKCKGFLTATTGTDNPTNANVGLIILGIISSINTVFIIIIILILYFKRRRRKETVYENQKVMGSPQTGANQIDNYSPEQQQAVHYETLGLSDRGSINNNSADAYTGLNMIEARMHQNHNS